MTDLPRDDDLDHVVDDDPADDLAADVAAELDALDDLADDPVLGGGELVPVDDPRAGFPDLVGDDAEAGGFDVGALLGGLTDAGGGGLMETMAEGLRRVQEARDATYEGVSGGGAVRIRATGGMEYEAVEIRPDVLADGDPELVADLVLAALRDLTAAQLAAQQQAMEGMPDLGGLGGLG